MLLTLSAGCLPATNLQSGELGPLGDRQQNRLPDALRGVRHLQVAVVARSPSNDHEVARDVEPALRPITDVVECWVLDVLAAYPARRAVPFDDVVANVGGHKPQAFELSLRRHHLNLRTEARTLDDEIQERVFNGILDDGYVIQYVPADTDSVIHRGTSCAYTVGRSMQGRPEFMVTGLPAEEAHKALDLLVMADNLVPLEAGGGVTVKDGSYRLVEAEPTIALGAVQTFPSARVLQGLWPSPAGTYPDQDEQLEMLQPVFPKGYWPRALRLVDDPYEED